MTPEDRQRIEAEERYRAEVRAGLEQKPSHWRQILWGVLISGLLVLAVFALAIAHQRIQDKAKADFDQSTPKPQQPQPKIETVRRLIINQPFVVEPRASYWFRVAIPSAARHASIDGHFAVEGTGSIDVALLPDDESNLQNWTNGNAAQTIKASEGKINSGNIDINNLEPGSYCLAFSNRLESAEVQQFLGVAIRYGLGGSLGALLNLAAPERQSLIERMRSTGQNVNAVLSAFVRKGVSANVFLNYQTELPAAQAPTDTLLPNSTWLTSRRQPQAEPVAQPEPADAPSCAAYDARFDSISIDPASPPNSNEIYQSFGQPTAWNTRDAGETFLFYDFPACPKVFVFVVNEFQGVQYKVRDTRETARLLQQ